MMGNPVGEIFYADKFERFMHPVMDGFLVQPEVGRTECNILLNCRGKYLVISILENNADKLAHFTDIVFGDGFTTNQDRARCRFKNTVKTFEKCALAGTVRPDHSYAGIAGSYEIEGMQCGDIPWIGVGKIAGLDKVHGKFRLV
jgi:hypothetical protein